MRLFGWLRKQKPESGDDDASQFRFIGGRRYVVGTPYLLPKDDAEINRLDFQHYMLRFALRGNYAAPIEAPHDILDVGTGTARWAVEMAQYFPEANIFGVDLVEPPVDTGNRPDIRPSNYVFVAANALEGLPFPDESFDFVHQRLLVGALPAAGWPRDVQELARLTRPGGWVELVEAAPVPSGGPALAQLMEWLVVACDRRGLDALVGPKIGGLLTNVGLVAVRYHEVPLPVGSYGGHLGRMTETNLISFLTSIRGLVLSYGLTDGLHFDSALAAARDEIAQGRYVWPYFVTYGQKPL